jgi:small neutral amino acid transporter SnatA (MarC family)
MLVYSSGIIIGIMLAAISIFIFYRFSQEFIKKWIKMKETLSKISAFILLAIAVQITSDGFIGLLKQNF